MNGHATPSEQVGKSEAATEQQQHLASSHELELVQVGPLTLFFFFFDWKRQSIGKSIHRLPYFGSRIRQMSLRFKLWQIKRGKIALVTRPDIIQKQVSALQVSLSEKDLKLEKSDKSYKSLQESYEGLKDEQEDLLIMLTDQEEKVKKYKKICKDLGHQGEMSDSSSSDNEDVGNDEWSYVPDNGMIC